jgi:hypothetical protein
MVLRSGANRCSRRAFLYMYSTLISQNRYIGGLNPRSSLTRQWTLLPAFLSPHLPLSPWGAAAPQALATAGNGLQEQRGKS